MQDLNHQTAELRAEIERLQGALARLSPYAALGRRVAAMAHQINTPLAVAIGRAAMLEETMASHPTVQAEARRIRQAAERGAQVMRRALEAARAAEAAQQPAPPGQHVLLVHGDGAVAGALRQRLTAAGLAVDTCIDGHDALERLRDRRYDALLCHLQMAPMDGWRFWRELREHHPRLASRVLFLSSEALSAGTRSFLAETGCQAITRPLDDDALQAALQDLLAA